MPGRSRVAAAACAPSWRRPASGPAGWWPATGTGCGAGRSARTGGCWPAARRGMTGRGRCRTGCWQWASSRRGTWCRNFSRSLPGRGRGRGVRGARPRKGPSRHSRTRRIRTRTWRRTRARPMRGPRTRRQTRKARGTTRAMAARLRAPREAAGRAGTRVRRTKTTLSTMPVSGAQLGPARLPEQTPSAWPRRARRPTRTAAWPASSAPCGARWPVTRRAGPPPHRIRSPPASPSSARTSSRTAKPAPPAAGACATPPSAAATRCSSWTCFPWLPRRTARPRSRCGGATPPTCGCWSSSLSRRSWTTKETWPSSTTRRRERGGWPRGGPTLSPSGPRWRGSSATTASPWTLRCSRATTPTGSTTAARSSPPCSCRLRISWHRCCARRRPNFRPVSSPASCSTCSTEFPPRTSDISSTTPPCASSGSRSPARSPRASGTAKTAPRPRRSSPSVPLFHLARQRHARRRAGPHPHLWRRRRPRLRPLCHPPPPRPDHPPRAAGGQALRPAVPRRPAGVLPLPRLGPRAPRQRCRARVAPPRVRGPRAPGGSGRVQAKGVERGAPRGGDHVCAGRRGAGADPGRATGGRGVASASGTVRGSGRAFGHLGRRQRAGRGAGPAGRRAEASRLQAAVRLRPGAEAAARGGAGGRLPAGAEAVSQGGGEGGFAAPGRAVFARGGRVPGVASRGRGAEAGQVGAGRGGEPEGV
ncbi:hypothetical protein DFJ74DRAFT_655724 [Hyaloraphidium curvatum]|nr:hypothetical protein DFJ74DRAFT_655724 [Hyaloraphidium curvatum]